MGAKQSDTNTNSYLKPQHIYIMMFMSIQAYNYMMGDILCIQSKSIQFQFGPKRRISCRVVTSYLYT